MSKAKSFEVTGKSRVWIVEPVSIPQTPTSSKVRWFVDYMDGNCQVNVRSFDQREIAVLWAQDN